MFNTALTMCNLNHCNKHTFDLKSKAWQWLIISPCNSIIDACGLPMHKEKRTLRLQI